MKLFKRHPVIGLVFGVTLVALALLSLPLSTHGGGAVAAQREDCPLARVSLDDGYGLTRVALRPDCR
jgi:hypothetical protein